MAQFDIKNFIQGNQNIDEYKEFNWTGTFQDYVDIVTKKPYVARNAFQRVYDMLVSYGYEEYTEFKKT